MRIIDQKGTEITAPDLSLGRLAMESVFIAHHDAVEAVEEQWHYETIAEYPNGGRDVQKVTDVPGVEAKAAWDEYEDILRYIPYTPEELAEMASKPSRPTLEDEVADLKEALEMLLSGVTE